MFSINPLKFQDFIIFDPVYVDKYTVFDIDSIIEYINAGLSLIHVLIYFWRKIKIY